MSIDTYLIPVKYQGVRSLRKVMEMLPLLNLNSSKDTPLLGKVTPVDVMETLLYGKPFPSLLSGFQMASQASFSINLNLGVVRNKDQQFLLSSLSAAAPDNWLQAFDAATDSNSAWAPQVAAGESSGANSTWGRFHYITVDTQVINGRALLVSEESTANRDSYQRSLPTPYRDSPVRAYPVIGDLAKLFLHDLLTINLGEEHNLLIGDLSESEAIEVDFLPVTVRLWHLSHSRSESRWCPNTRMTMKSLRQHILDMGVTHQLGQGGSTRVSISTPAIKEQLALGSPTMTRLSRLVEKYA